MAAADPIRRRALALVARGSPGVAGRLASHFRISRQASNAHLQALVRAGLLEATGSTRARVYRLATLRESLRSYPRQGLREDVVWQEVFAPIVAGFPENVRDMHVALKEVGAVYASALTHQGWDALQGKKRTPTPTNPGAIPFTRMPGASARARAFVIFTTPAFAAP